MIEWCITNIAQKINLLFQSCSIRNLLHMWRNQMFLKEQNVTVREIVYVRGVTKATSTFVRKRDEPIHASPLSYSGRDWNPRNYAIPIVVSWAQSARARRIMTNCNKALRRTHRWKWCGGPCAQSFYPGSHDILCNRGTLADLCALTNTNNISSFIDITKA